MTKLMADNHHICLENKDLNVTSNKTIAYHI